jgi:hypothetical protein
VAGVPVSDDSPTGIHEANRLDNVRVQTDVVVAMERAVARLRATS